VLASVASCDFDSFLDIGFRATSTEGIEALITADLLAFARLPPVVPELLLEIQVDEERHAYTGIYPNTQPYSCTKALLDRC
jgi:hypothetical protein